MWEFMKSALSRNSDPITSDQAAEQVDVTALQQIVLLCLRNWPSGLTCREIAHSTNLELGSITPRMRQLEEKGLIYREGTRRVGGCRTKAIVWKAVR